MTADEGLDPAWTAGVIANARGILATRVHPPLVAAHGGEWVAVCGEPECGGTDRHRETGPDEGDVTEAIALHIAGVHWPTEE